MWRISIILNALFLLVCAVFSGIPFLILQNRFVDYPPKDGRPLPVLTQAVLGSGWVLIALPLIGLVTTIAIFAFFRSRPIPGHLLSTHLSATVLLGVTTFLTFLAGGVLPFIPVIVGMQAR